MVTLLTITIIASLVSLLSGMIFLMIFGKKFARETSTCPKCRGVNSVSTDISNSCLKIKCQSENCDYHSSLSVRPSALSLFGLAQLLLTIIMGVFGFVLGHKIGYRPIGKIVVVFACLVIGGIFSRIFVRSITFFLLDHSHSPIWKKEIVSYLASPILKKEGGKEDL